jgi:hypothetical protein
VKPIVPPELREVLTLMHELTESLPMPEKGANGWDARHDREIWRQATLKAHLGTLVSQLESCEKYPSVAEQGLLNCCQQSVKTIREELAKPLGYEPEKASGFDHEVEGA